MGEQTLGAQAVAAVQQGHEELPGLDVAPHEDVALPPVDQLNGHLGHIVPGVGLHQAVGLVLQPQLVQHGQDLSGLAHQHQVGKPGLLGLEGAQQDIFRVCPGDHHPVLDPGVFRPLYNRFKTSQRHNVFSPVPGGRGSRRPNFCP